MADYLRLDKYLADMGIGTRSEVKGDIRKGKVSVDGVVVNAPETKVLPGVSVIMHMGETIGYTEYEYYMLNKPAGVVTATTDKNDRTVMDLLEIPRKQDYFPVGRLDKDTEGLLLITNDGPLAHELLSPKKHIPKTYFAKIEGKVTQEDIDAFLEGVYIEKDVKTKPGQLVIKKSDAISEIELTIYEGKFHQVKRMFEAVGKKVIYLRRVSMGALNLDEQLALGEYRKLTQKELEELLKLNRI